MSSRVFCTAGHFIQFCPTNNDPAYDGNRRGVRPPSIGSIPAAVAAQPGQPAHAYAPALQAAPASAHPYPPMQPASSSGAYLPAHSQAAQLQPGQPMSQAMMMGQQAAPGQQQLQQQQPQWQQQQQQQQWQQQQQIQQPASIAACPPLAPAVSAPASVTVMPGGAAGPTAATAAQAGAQPLPAASAVTPPLSSGYAKQGAMVGRKICSTPTIEKHVLIIHCQGSMLRRPSGKGDAADGVPCRAMDATRLIFCIPSCSCILHSYHLRC